MDNKEIANKIMGEMGEINSKYIDEATMKKRGFSKKKVLEKVVAFGAMAACVGIVIAGATRFLGLLQKNETAPPTNQEEPSKDKIYINNQYSLAIGSIDMLYEESDLVVEVTVGKEVGKIADCGVKDEMDEYFESEFLSLEINVVYKGDIYENIDFQNKKVKDGYIVENHVDYNMKEGEIYVMFLTYDVGNDLYTLTQDMLGCLKIDGYKVEAGENNFIFDDCTHKNDLERILTECNMEFKCQYLEFSSKINHACVKVINYDMETGIVKAIAMEDAWPADDSVCEGDIVEFNYDDILKNKKFLSEYPFPEEELEKQLFNVNFMLREGDYLDIEIEEIEKGEDVKKLKVAVGKLEGIAGKVLEVDHIAGIMVILRNDVEMTVNYSPERVSVIRSVLDSSISDNVIEVGDMVYANTYYPFLSISDLGNGFSYASGIECFKGIKGDVEPVKVEVVESQIFTVEKPIKNTVYSSVQEWQDAVKESDVEDIDEALEKYDEAFFEKYDLCFFSKASSRNVKYSMVKYEAESIDGKDVLNVYMDRDYSMAMNTLSSYYFFIVIDKEYIEKYDEVSMVEE